MPDLQDGESIHVQGSAARPYQLKNVGDVYSCSCPAWRNQSLPIERRTCKHLRALRGDAAEEARIGTMLVAHSGSVDKAAVPPLLLAESWDGELDIRGWWLSEKLDGVRAYWTGSQFLSRQGNVYHAPAWFTAGLPDQPLDGELWLDRKQFQRTVSIVRRHDQPEAWKDVTFVVFDAPQIDDIFEERLRFVFERIGPARTRFARPHPHECCESTADVHRELARIEALGGEGLMLRQPTSRYEIGRSSTLLKVKRFHDAEARVIGHLPGTGRHRGRLGALLVETAEGVQFAVGTGLSDQERERPPAPGTLIRYRFQELTDAGLPRFPVFTGACTDEAPAPQPHAKGEITMANARRFKFVGGGSDKFWEVEVQGKDVSVRFGRNGTDGQTQTKTFPDEAAARRHADKLMREKVGKGYTERV